MIKPLHLFEIRSSYAGTLLWVLMYEGGSKRGEKGEGRGKESGRREVSRGTIRFDLLLNA